MRKSRICLPPAPTSCRSTSPTCRRGPRRRAQFGLEALNRALDGVTGTTAVHICFGYAAIIHERPSGYSFLPELAGCSCRADLDRNRAVEPGLRGVGQAAGQDRSCSACIDLSDMNVETPEMVAARIRRALPLRRPEERHHRPGLRHEVPAPRSRLGEDASHGRGRAHSAPRARRVISRDGSPGARGRPVPLA